MATMRLAVVPPAAMLLAQRGSVHGLTKPGEAA